MLVSQATQTLIEDEEEAEPGFTLVDVGEHLLKDLDRPVRLFQLAAAGLDPPAVPGRGWQAAGQPGGPGTVLAGRDAAPDAGGGAAVVHGLPVALTSFVGRDELVREVAGLLAEHRLVTVTGPDGSGKTRLAAEVAARFADGPGWWSWHRRTMRGRSRPWWRRRWGSETCLGCRRPRHWCGRWPGGSCCWCWTTAST